MSTVNESMVWTYGIFPVASVSISTLLAYLASEAFIWYVDNIWEADSE